MTTLIVLVVISADLGASTWLILRTIRENRCRRFYRPKIDLTPHTPPKEPTQ